MDFSIFDTREYRTVPVTEGYAQWVPTYEDTVQDEMDLRLLERLSSVRWSAVESALDLACGTGRAGAWLRARGVRYIDGVDLTPEMLERARAKKVYRDLIRGDVRNTKLEAAQYELVIQCLADEHLPELDGLYREAARVARDRATFVVVGYHPHFLMQGIATHFHTADGTPLAIESHVHLTSAHVTAGLGNDWRLVEMSEGIVDAAWLAKKPRWKRYESRPVSFALVWERG